MSATATNAVHARSAPPGAPHLVYVVNVDWFFLSHRLPLALAARDAGLRVTIVAADTGRAGEITGHGLEFVPLRVSRDGMNPVAEAAALAGMRRLYRRLRPDVVHHVTNKPVLYGSLAARFRGGPAVVNAMSGLGYLFSPGRRKSLLGRALQSAFRVALGGRRTRTIFQNPEDRDEFVRIGLVRQDRTVLIRGSGADVNRFVPAPEPPGPPVVLLASRMLWDKGIAEFVQAARLLRGRGVQARFVLAGRADDENPGAISAAQLKEWAAEGAVEWWGNRTDMPQVLASASVVALPTVYKEGVPKVLLEAGAAGRPLIASDVPGCREIVRPGVNGVRVPPRDVEALAAAIEGLLASPELRARYGAASRAIVEAEFTEEQVVRQTLELYREVLGPRWPGSGG